MTKLPKEKISQEVFDLYDDYAHNKIDRREFVQRLAAFAVGGITLSSLMSAVMPEYEQTIQVPENDPRLQVRRITYQSPDGGGQINAQLSMPAGTKGPLPGVVVVHENRGLNPHIADVARRVALAGFVSIAPDALTPLGGYPGNDDEGRALQKQREKDSMLRDFIAAYEYLKNHEACTGKVGVVGFCFGGWVSNMMAVEVAGLDAAVPYYGTQPAADRVPEIQAPLMLHYAEHDQRVNAGWPAYEEALKANDKKYIAYMYPDTNHGFNNDSTSRYDKEAATLAWERTLAFFKEHLGG